MHKSALLLTAATFALLSGQALATTATTTNACLKNTDDITDITKKVVGPVCTSTAKSGKPGPIVIEANGTIAVAAVSGATPTIFPAVTIDSSNLVTNKGTINFTGTNNSIGIQLNTGNKAGFDFQTGTVDMLQGGTNKVGILITDPTSGKTGTFTGVFMPDALVPITKRLTAIDLEAGSTFEIQGDGSQGIELASGNKVVGDIDVGGILTLTPSKANEAAGTGTASIGVNLLGSIKGDFHVVDGGTIQVEGPSSQGVVVGGKIDGEFWNEGTIAAVGTTTPDANKTTNAVSGIGVLIEDSITGGILNDGPVTGSTSTTTGFGTISVTGSSPALDITATDGNLKVGVVNDKINSGFSLINRGTIAASTPNPELNTTAVLIAGSATSDKVEFAGGILDAGIISAASTTKAATASSTVTSIGLDLENYVTVPKLVVSNETGSGSITASVTGDQPGIAQAVFIDAKASLKELDVDQGSSITAGASTSDNTNSVMEAVAIDDVSGSLQTIKNNGTISASATTLTSDQQVVVAIAAAGNSSGLKITDGGSITGDIILGSGADTLTIGDSISTTTTTASVTGNVFFGGNLSAKGKFDNLIINTFGSFAGQLEEPLNQRMNISVDSGGSLTIENNGVEFDRVDTNSNNQPIANVCPSQPEACGVQAQSFTTANGSNLTVDVAQVFNQDGTTTIPPYVINAKKATIADGTNFSVGYGSFVNAVGKAGSQFVLVGTPKGDLSIGDFGSLQADVVAETPFLFDGSLCTVNVKNGTACATVPKNVTGSALILTLDPKTAATLGLHGFAQSMFDHANAALANDTTLGAAVISAGLPVAGKPLTPGEGAALYQNIYAQFAPDVTGSARAIAVSLTDQGTGEVGARQRALRMYAGQDGDTTLWGQEFTQNINVGNKSTAGGYEDSGFGFVLGADGGTPRNGRYGAAFQFFSGGTTEKLPRTDKTNSEWMVLTGYTDWRGKGFFFDSQASIGYAQLKGQRFINVGPTGAQVSRDARGDRSSEFLAGGATAGVIMAAGGTVFTPQLSLDGLTMREEGYQESSNTPFSVIPKAQDGFDLTVKPNYMNSLRLFAGADVRQDLNFGGFYLQPELRAGYRYDFLGGQEKVKAAFVSQASDPANYFSITGPDPARGNVVLGGGLATTSGAWSVGVSYDYILGIGGTKTLDQVGTFTIVGRM